MNIYNCVYRFLNSANEIIYIGKAKNLDNRLKSHDHLPKQCYIDCTRIEYTQFNNEFEMDFAERYFIPKIRPKYNTVMNHDYMSFDIEELDNLKWNLYIKPEDRPRRKKINLTKGKLQLKRAHAKYLNKYLKHCISLKKNKIQLANAHITWERKKFLHNEKMEIARYIEENKNKKIICIYSGRIFNNIEDACNYYGVSIRDIYYQVKYTVFEREKINRIFYKNSIPPIEIELEDTQLYGIFPHLEYYKNSHKEEYEKNKNRYAKKVECINTGTIFKNVQQASDMLGFNSSSIHDIIDVCIGKRKSYPTKVDTPLYWRFV